MKLSQHILTPFIRYHSDIVSHDFRIQTIADDAQGLASDLTNGAMRAGSDLTLEIEQLETVLKSWDPIVLHQFEVETNWEWLDELGAQDALRIVLQEMLDAAKYRLNWESTRRKNMEV